VVTAGVVALLLWSREPAAGPPAKDAAAAIVKPAAAPPKVVFLLAAKGFYYPDYEPVREVFERDGKIEVIVASSAWGPAVPEPFPPGGKAVKVDRLVDQIGPDEFDAIIVCGGKGVGEYFDGPSAPAAEGLVNGMVKRQKVVTALCMGTYVLARTGVLSRCRATGFPPMAESKIREFGGIYVDQPVVVSGEGDRIITGRDPQSAVPFAEAVRKALLESPPR
jgi:putative intracellular protease/amidase